LSVGIDDVVPDVALNNLVYETINGAAASCQRLQYLVALIFFFQRSFDCIQLAANAADAVQQILLIS
jgi:hypothetical protein